MPVHLAIENGSGLETIRALLDAYPDAASQVDQYDRLPLHLAAEHGACVEVVRALIACDRDAVDTAGKFDGQLALHHAARSQASSDVVAELLAAYPEGAQLKERCHHVLPLHLAAMHSSDVQKVRLLLDAQRRAASTKTVLGWYPHQLAEQRQGTKSAARREIVSLLREAFRPDDTGREGRGNLLPKVKRKQRSPSHQRAATSRRAISRYRRPVTQRSVEQQQSPVFCYHATQGKKNLVDPPIHAMPRAAHWPGHTG